MVTRYVGVHNIVCRTILGLNIDLNGLDIALHAFLICPCNFLGDLINIIFSTAELNPDLDLRISFLSGSLLCCGSLCRSGFLRSSFLCSGCSLLLVCGSISNSSLNGIGYNLCLYINDWYGICFFSSLA